ncbi:hypothetical protein M0R04_07095 [Candidatus Dojkabacteria bacterium]|jgi:hypothetical protein|nr:hypothetical protein [Candidatus Dojkabacteria bacterium]
MSLIKQAYNVDIKNTTQHNYIRENIKHIAKRQFTTPALIAEGVTHVLAGLGQTAQYMHPNTVAAFLAGVSKLSDELVSTDDANKKNKTLKILTAAAMKFDDLTKQSLPNQSVVIIAQYGARFPELMQQYVKIASSSNPEQINQAARQLLTPIEQAMNMASKASETLASNPSSSAGVSTQTN